MCESTGLFVFIDKFGINFKILAKRFTATRRGLMEYVVDYMVQRLKRAFLYFFLFLLMVLLPIVVAILLTLSSEDAVDDGLIDTSSVKEDSE